MTLSSIAIVSGKELANYHFGDQHPFGPDRHQAFLDGMERLGISDAVEWLTPVQCGKEALESFHSKEFIEKVITESARGEGYLDHGDTPSRKGIFEATCYIVGSVCDLADRIIEGEFRRGFIPIAGLHHGYRDHCSGFCVFNDCGVLIERLRRKHHLRKILYVDIDAHHGDGVFYNYESDSEVFIVDFHEDGKYLYPGSGDVDETGSGPAQGSKMNFPMPMQANDHDLAHLWEVAELFIRSIEPEFIIFQCGADSMKGDPITHLEYSEKSYQLVTSSLCRLADEFSEGRLIALGGGGYNMDNIARAWPGVVQTLVDEVT